MLFVLYWCLSILILGSPFHWIHASGKSIHYFARKSQKDPCCTFCNLFRSSICYLCRPKGFIRCEKGTKIKIISAVYGRTDDKLCPYGDTNTRTCRSLTSDIKVKWSCNGYKTCHLHASDQIFGDPCQNVSKYLEVKYRCIIKEDQDTRVKGSFFYV